MSIAEETFKRAMAQFATGVTVVATVGEERPVGITANAFCSVSLEPRLVLVCVARTLYTHEQIVRSGVFSVSVLASEQLEWADRFAGRIPEGEDRFDSIPYFTATTGAPILPGCLSWVDCEVRHAYDGGDHTIFVGEVVECAVEAGREPLLYYEARWSRLAQEGPLAGSSWPGEDDPNLE